MLDQILEYSLRDLLQRRESRPLLGWVVELRRYIGGRLSLNRGSVALRRAQATVTRVKL
jgi:hypothetical protein